jgi:hypothetical protein
MATQPDSSPRTEPGAIPVTLEVNGAAVSLPLAPWVTLLHLSMANAAASVAPARFLAGGANLIDLMKEDVEWPHTLIDVNRLPLHAIEELADHPVVRARYPVLSSAILSGATRQLRNVTTDGAAREAIEKTGSA